jgi:uncharacterized protein
MGGTREGPVNLELQPGYKAFCKRFSGRIKGTIAIILLCVIIVLGSAPSTAGALEDARAASKKGDFATALRLYLPLAEQGNVEAQTQVAFQYYLCAVLSAPQDLPKKKPSVEFVKTCRGVTYSDAAEWYRRAAEQGDANGQYVLGNMLLEGKGVTQNYVEAAKWYRRSAEQGKSDAQYALGGAYFAGKGVPQDDLQAYMWLSLATAKVQLYAKDRDIVAKYMTPAQIAEAQKLAAEWSPKTARESLNITPQSPSPKKPSPREPETAATSGTAFFVSKNGEALTNAHVVEGCQQIRISGAQAHLLARDSKNDLALLATDLHPAQWATLRTSVRQGEDIVVYGFPLPGVLSSDGNVSTGNVTALTGLGDDSRFLQISAPVQPGNSGGPLLDRNGNVVGIVVSKLNALSVASATGDVPQNVNFAIKASVALAFLETQKVAGAAEMNLLLESERRGILPPDKAAMLQEARRRGLVPPPLESGTLSTPDITALAQTITVQVLCIR